MFAIVFELVVLSIYLVIIYKFIVAIVSVDYLDGGHKTAKLFETSPLFVAVFFYSHPFSTLAQNKAVFKFSLPVILLNYNNFIFLLGQSKIKCPARPLYSVAVCFHLRFIHLLKFIC